MKKPPPDVYVYLAAAFMFCGNSVLAMICIALHLTRGRPFGPRPKSKPRKRGKR